MLVYVEQRLSQLKQEVAILKTQLPMRAEKAQRNTYGAGAIRPFTYKSY